ncbi:MAG: VOC family protein [Woeseiaceae bacterium]|nr:VOC family protein [Woeseiaceae bacterium]
MIRIKRLDNVVIRAKNSVTMCDFYCDVLGCTVERESTAELGLIQLRAGNALIDLVSVDGYLGRLGGQAPGEGGRNMDHFCVLVESFDEQAIRTHLAKFNVIGSDLEQRYGAEGYGSSIYIQDPEGNTVELKGPQVESGT